jgi:enterochelin esterase-like enzyme
MELVGLIDREYRTVPDRRHRVVAGLSEGGFGAANLAARHPAVFGVAISLSGYFSAQGPVFGDNAAYRRANSPSSIVRDEPAARSVSYIVAAGDQDQRYLKEAQAFADELDRLHVRHELFLITGGHEGGVWTSGLVLGLQRVKSQLESRPS